MATMAMEWSSTADALARCAARLRRHLVRALRPRLLMEHVNVRYIVDDVDAAIEFYRANLGFEVSMHPAPGFAALSHGACRLYLNKPGAGGAGKSTPAGAPEPGGWNRLQIEVDDLTKLHATLRARGARFRSDIVQGQGGRQVLVEDPSGNPIELFEPQRGGAHPVPRGYHTVTPFFAADDLSKLIDFVVSAFGAVVVRRMTSEDGIVRHATVRIGDSNLMLSSGTDIYGARPSTLHLYVDDVDALHARAVAAGARSLEEPRDQFYGDRRAGVADSWNNHWWLATHVEDVDEETLKKREAEFRRGG
jgi:uncharacterized glyoxalase superfamily protein PhnB